MSSVSATDIDAIRADFPLLSQSVNQVPLAYLDNAATTQKPRAVIEAIRSFYLHDNANVHRGLYALSMRATAHYEAARQTIADFIGAREERECVFLRGTTEGINLVASAYAMERLSSQDEILITHLEHHSNIVPWQRVCEKTGAKLVVVPISPQGEVQIEAFEKCLSAHTKIVAITYASNAIGTINPVKQMIEMAHAVGAVVLVDGAQAVPHMKVNVQALGCDFFAFSGHKVFGPTGIGVLWARAELLESMAIYQGGGEMVHTVTFEKTTYAPIPAKFEAGTPNVSGAIGLASAIRYLETLDQAALMAYEAELLAYATTALKTLKNFRIVGEATHKVPILSFYHPAIHAHDIGTVLDHEGIAIRSGHHCAMPLISFYQVPALNRLSLAFYNTKTEIDRCIEALQKAEHLLG